MRRQQVKENDHLRKPRLLLETRAKNQDASFSLLALAALALSLLACRQYCVTQVATRPGRISSQEDFLPSQLEHLHIAQFKGDTVFSLGIVCDAISFCTLLIFQLLSLTLFFSFFLLFTFVSAGDISGAVQTLRALLLFYPSDKDSLDNLQLYSETLGGDTESQGIQPTQVHLQTIHCFCDRKHFSSKVYYCVNFRIAHISVILIHRRFPSISDALCKKRSCCIMG